MIFRQLFDPDTSSYTYLIADEETREAILIDAVYEQAERDARLVKELGLKLIYTLDTHAHADHVTGASILKEKLGSQSALSANAGVDCVDRPLKEGDVIDVGNLRLEVLETPGHTAGCLTYVLRHGGETYAFTGDALLIRGCGRTDFQAGDAGQLYTSINAKVFALPDDTYVYPAHDYHGLTVSTVAEEKAFNPRLGKGKTLEEFKEIMDNLNLPYPKRIDTALPANMACGRMG